MASSGTWRHFDELLVNSVEKYPCLYDIKLREFKDNTLKANAWSETVEDLGTIGACLLTFSLFRHEKLYISKHLFPGEAQKWFYKQFFLSEIHGEYPKNEKAQLLRYLLCVRGVEVGLNAPQYH